MNRGLLLYIGVLRFYFENGRTHQTLSLLFSSSEPKRVVSELDYLNRLGSTLWEVEGLSGNAPRACFCHSCEGF